MSQPPTGAGFELVQDLDTMLREQAAAAQEREQRLFSMMEDLLRGQGQVQTEALPAASALNMNVSPPKLPVSATPAPHLAGQANLRELAIWRS